ncbi:uncharacterized protein LOC129946231 [Eupeodes corollae]|uniref:uncharacterized protein LOC129946231 n=1 Tax=Eupeodes corollae TaxID=290404 RepID=UPI0024904A30|nr:uncharacterized protein LOC129946231 [Eupeodes corollae]
MAFQKEVHKANHQIKHKANEALPPSIIIRDTITMVEPACRPSLPSKAAQKMRIHRVRESLIKEPSTLEEICIPEHIKYTDGELFVLSEDSYPGGKNILLGTRQTIQLLSEAKCWLVDGTFAVVPTIMGQLFSVHGHIDGIVVPLVYCLMSRKSKEAYEEFWLQLLKCACELNISLNPERIISDFEMAIIRSAQTFFPNTQTNGCLFHFGQIIWRKVQNLSFQVKYGQNENFAMEIRMIKALAFVPPGEVLEYFEAAYGALEFAESKTLAKWFKRNYLGSSSSRPRYSPDFWTTGAASETSFPRTQNSVEAWHRRLKVVVSQRHAGLYKLIGDLSKECIVAKLSVERVRRGEESPTTKAVKKNEKLQRVLSRRTSGDKVQYLRNVAHNLSLA